jgi:hypothetical protein
MNEAMEMESRNAPRHAAGQKTPQLIYSTYTGDLSQLPADIKSCPHCGEIISTLGCEATPTKTAESKPKTKKIRKYAKITLIAEAGISAVCFFLGLPPPFLITGIIMAVVSAIILVRTKVVAPAGKVEVSPKMRKMMRISKLTVLSGELIAAVFIALLLLGSGVIGRVQTSPESDASDMFPVLAEQRSTLWNVFFAGILIAGASAIALKMMRTEEGIVKPSEVELYIRKILGAVLILFAAALVLGLPGSAIVLSFVLIMGIYLWRSKRYRLAADILFFRLGFGCIPPYPAPF